MPHRHQENADIDPVTAAPARTEPAAPVLLRAAAAGRTDVLGSAGLLGVQRAAGNTATAQLVADERAEDESVAAGATGAPSVQDIVGRGGSGLPADVRTEMEARMGQDFSDVRIHTDGQADASARSVDARAYTVGSDIVFQRGTWDPASTAGRTLLAHELTHVVQQRSGPVEGTPIGGGVSVSDPSDRFEREAAANAEAVMTGPVPVQRDAAPEAVTEEEPEEEVSP